jgi:hypothetical protein
MHIPLTLRWWFRQLTALMAAANLIWVWMDLLVGHNGLAALNALGGIGLIYVLWDSEEAYQQYRKTRK